MRLLVSLVVSILISTSLYTYALEELPKVDEKWTLTSNFGKAAQTRCLAKVKLANVGCFDYAKLDIAQAAGGSAAVVNGVDPKNNMQQGQASRFMGMSRTRAFSAAASKCSTAESTCEDGCSRFQSDLQSQSTQEKSQGDILQAKANSATDESIRTQLQNSARMRYEQSTALENDAKFIGSIVRDCKTTYGFYKNEYTLESKRSIGETGESQNTINSLATTSTGSESAVDGKGIGDWIMDNKGKVALGVLGVAGVGMLIKKNNDDDGGSNQESITEKEKELAQAAAADPTCLTERSYEFAHCQKYLKSLCAKPTEMDNAKCVKFADQYCGFYETTKAKTEGSPAEGLDTQLCADTMAHSYCSKVGRSGCFSCLRLRDMSTATCQSQPASCERTPSDTEMTQYKAACSDDPVFSQPKWAHIKVQGVNTAASSAGGSIMGGSSTLASNGSLPGDVGSAQGATALVRTSQIIQQVCDQGLLNYCGPRVGAQ